MAKEAKRAVRDLGHDFYGHVNGAGALDGVRVIDLTRARSGPTCVRQLTDMGADAIQVLRPGAGSFAGSDAWNLHRNKRSIVVDLRTAAGLDILFRLVEKADVLVENWRPSVKYRLGVDPEALWRINPRLVYGSISGFGQSGPYARRPGLDQIAQGLGGVMTVTGPTGSGPWRVGFAVSDTVSGPFLTQGILAALLVRERTGRGQWVHTSLVETMLNIMDFQATRWLIDGEVPEQAGNGHPTIAAIGVYRTADGFINVAPLDFESFCNTIEASHIVSDPRFSGTAARLIHREELQQQIEGVLSTRTSEEWLDALSEIVPCGPILNVAESFDDPQVQHLRMTRAVPRSAETIEVLRLPLTFSETPASVRSGPPEPGHDTLEVLDELGFTSRQVDQLVDSGVVGTGDR